MNAAKHTPGPWRVGRPGSVVADTPVPEMNGSEAVDYYGGHMVCESVVERNARLIAAAPDMLEALQKLVESADGFSVSGVYFNEFEEHIEVLQAAYAAIEKATGSAA